MNALETLIFLPDHCFSSIYDTSAVFLGNFDFLIRRNLSPFEFLSVWNEYIEEGVRGASVDNINTIFVAAQKADVLQATLESEIELLVNDADDTYKISFVDIIEEEISVTIDAEISKIYDPAEVESKIRSLILDNYGQDTAFAKRGFSKIRYRDVYVIRLVISSLRLGTPEMTLAMIKQQPIQDQALL